ncbi:unnamed protein product [Kuraishia capsulata CBS 1993]|uniref:Uncharacterized protein n=1 Tax=Kuraishia capsulata CBS 1993 TaxID=1382522 RepID=W6MME6_9ASCO|nr:uncharacterized protein KUCA_T00003351001 [Kuraishia capsulata CBS 1993]CDK27373.1 unnamed protein product [Kuraishia capsulata CBS 1993]
MLRTSLNTAARSTQRFGTVRCASALSNATVTNIEARWEQIPESDQKDIIDALSERQKLPWTDLTNAEKKASWYISFGEWGPRRPVHSSADKTYIFWGVVIGLSLSATTFLAFRSQRNVPKTMNREWQEASDEILKERNTNPFTGYSQVQSK